MVFKFGSLDSAPDDNEASEAADLLADLQAEARERGQATRAPTAAESSATIIGVLLEHGEAPYNFDESKNANYFVKIRDASGADKVHWGLDFARALPAAGVNVGDTIALENLGKQPFTVPDAAGGEKTVERQAWRVEPVGVPVAASEAVPQAVVTQDAPTVGPEIESVPVVDAKPEEKIDDDDEFDEFGNPKRRVGMAATGVIGSAAAPKSAPVVKPALAAKPSAAMVATPAMTKDEAEVMSRFAGLKDKPAAAQVQQAQPVPRESMGAATGRLLADVVASPFMALSSASRHLQQKFPGKSAVPNGPRTTAGSLSASMGAGLPMAVANTLENITDWKCERIEKAAREVHVTADALLGTEEFVMWVERVHAVATAKGVSPEEIVGRMHLKDDAELAPLKEGMDTLWKHHPDKIDAYRTACDVFEKNLGNVKKEFANSDERTKDRVTTAMTDAAEKTKHLPGYGEQDGEYIKTLAERIRLIAQQMAAFVQALLSRITGKKANPEMVP